MIWRHWAVGAASALKLAGGSGCAIHTACQLQLILTAGSNNPGLNGEFFCSHCPQMPTVRGILNGLLGQCEKGLSGKTRRGVPAESVICTAVVSKQLSQLEKGIWNQGRKAMAFMCAGWRTAIVFSRLISAQSSVNNLNTESPKRESTPAASYADVTVLIATKLLTAKYKLYYNSIFLPIVQFSIVSSVLQKQWDTYTCSLVKLPPG